MSRFQTFCVVAFLIGSFGFGFLYTPHVFARQAPENTPGSNSQNTVSQTSSVVPASPSSQGVYTGTTPSEGQFVPLAGIPGISNTAGEQNLVDYINALFRILIGIGALLAVIRITIAGIKYMTTEAFSTKGQAKEDIRESLVGLLIILSVVMILQIINPNILRLDFLGGAPQLQYSLELPEIAAGWSRTFDDPISGAQKNTLEQSCRQGGNVFVERFGNTYRCVNVAPGYEASAPDTRGLTPEKLEELSKDCLSNGGKPEIGEVQIGIPPEDGTPAQTGASFSCEDDYLIDAGEFVEISEDDMQDLNIAALDAHCLDDGGIPGAPTSNGSGGYTYRCHEDVYGQAAAQGGPAISRSDADILLENDIAPEQIIDSIDSDTMRTDPAQVTVFTAACAQSGGTVFDTTRDAVYCIEE